MFPATALMMTAAIFLPIRFIAFEKAAASLYGRTIVRIRLDAGLVGDPNVAAPEPALHEERIGVAAPLELDDAWRAS
jgi:hypothetical protein